MMAKRAGLNEERIVQAAAKLVDKQGPHELSMAALAAQLGVRAPTLYHHVAGGLAGVKRALTLLGLEEASHRLGRAVMGKAGDDAVVALAHALRDFAKERPGIYELVQQAPDPDDDEWQAAGREVVEIMLRAFSAYELSEEDTLHAVRMLRSVVQGCVSLENLGGFGLPLEIDETFRRLIVSQLDYLHNYIAG
jgi:AcrR family transcriptional regulator